MSWLAAVVVSSCPRRATDIEGKRKWETESLRGVEEREATGVWSPLPYYSSFMIKYENEIYFNTDYLLMFVSPDECIFTKQEWEK